MAPNMSGFNPREPERRKLCADWVGAAVGRGSPSAAAGSGRGLGESAGTPPGIGK